MLVSKYNPTEHGRHVESMLMSQGMDPALVRDLPVNGFIALDRSSNPIAIGFIRLIEGRYGMVDSYLTSTSADATERNLALNRVTLKLISDSKRQGLRGLMAFSAEPNIVTRALNLGFKQTQHHFLILGH